MNQSLEMDKDIFLKRIGVLMGGCSSERNISIKSGTAVAKALKEGGCDVVLIDIHSEDRIKVVERLIREKIDIAFIALHGRFGEDGKIQEILESLDIPYTGSGPKANSLAINKILTYQILEEHGVLVPPHVAFSSQADDYLEIITEKFNGCPVVVKPCSEGSSIGISIITNYNNLNDAVKRAFCYDSEVIVEQYIPGKEFTAGILGAQALPVVEIRPKNDFFDFSAKYESGTTDYIVPAEIDSVLSEEIKDIAQKVHYALGCSDLSRVDFILDKNNKPYVLELNTIPGMTATSLLPKAALASGIDFIQLCLTIVNFSYGEKNKKT
ncbi:MAG: D-alanine--D-alanine ligase [Candidatus Omnitrophica bacterium]|nr:D-alanine--D-alanine ligase [Candidatus Omnitrophota bacterium]